MTEGGVFDLAFNHLMVAEGGGALVRNPNDPGGSTKWGISLRFLRDVRKNPNLDESEIAGLTREAARDLAYEHFYLPLGLKDCTNEKAAIILLDQAFNRGVGPVTEQLKLLLGPKFSPSFPTLSSLLNFYGDHADILEASYSFLIHFLVSSQEAYISIVKAKPNLITFLPGWLHRTHALFAVIA